MLVLVVRHPQPHIVGDVGRAIWSHVDVACPAAGAREAVRLVDAAAALRGVNRMLPLTLELYSNSY